MGETRNGAVIAQMREVSRWFEGGRSSQRILVLDRVSFEVRQQEIVALIGPSGAGKTTIVRILCGLIPPSEGTVLFHGEPLRGVYPGAGVVFQSFALFPWLSAVENVELGLLARGMDRRLAREKAVAMMDLIGLDGFEEAMPRELSGGMKQRIGFARALVLEPEVLCMDEPFSGLDVLTAENLRGEFMDLWVERKIPTQAVLLVTHNIEEAVFMADRVVILWHNPGRVAAEMTIPLSHPRDRKSPAFKRLVDRIYTTMAHQAEMETSSRLRPLTLRKFQMLPQAPVGALSGLLELVEERGGREDIYELEDELSLEADDLLPLAEAAGILGFARIEEGDIVLTDLGRRFVTSDILESKEVFREAAVQNVLLIQQILHALRGSPRRSMNEEFFIEFLRNHFTEEEAWRQLETAVDWGRYAELFAYDEEAGVLYLESDSPSAEPRAAAESVSE